MSRHKIIVNPTPGRGAGDRAARQIETLLGERGLDFDLVRTRQPWHAAELAREAVADGYDCVVAVGGDGTANEVINGLMRAKHEGLGTCTMGMPCVGRGNDFTYGEEIPQDLEAGCKALAQGHRRWIDVGRVAGGQYPEGRFFGNGVGIGFDAVVVTALNGALPAHADGETLCPDGKRLEFELLPLEIEIISAAPGPGSLPRQEDTT